MGAAILKREAPAEFRILDINAAAQQQGGKEGQSLLWLGGPGEPTQMRVHEPSTLRPAACLGMVHTVSEAHRTHRREQRHAVS